MVIIGVGDLYYHYRDIAFDLNQSRIEIQPASLRCVCFLLYRNKLVTIGLNTAKTHPMIMKLGYDMYRRRYPLHAELDAVMKAQKKKARFDTMLIYRGFNADLPSCPCNECSTWIRDLDVRVIYTTQIGIAVVYSQKLKGHIKEF